MWLAQRQQRIRALLEAFGQVSVDRIVAELGVSRETVRRDLKSMEENGILRRIHGGIVPVDREGEAPYAVRARAHRHAKQAISHACLQFARPGQTLLIDAGSTTATLAESLATLGGLLVFTNSIEVAAHLSTASAREKQNRVVLLGGEYIDQPPSTCGIATLNAIATINADVAFASPYGLDVTEGATYFSLDEAEITRAMFARARQRIILADHSKLGIKGRMRVAGIQDLDHIVINARATDCIEYEALREVAGKRLVIGAGSS